MFNMEQVAEKQQGQCGEDCTKLNKETDPAYLVIDYGEQLLRDLEDTRDEVQNEIVSLLDRMNRLWGVQVNYMIFSSPILLGLMCTTLTCLFLPTTLATWLGTVLMSLTIGFTFLTLSPLSEAITHYQDHTLYNPYFRKCECDQCRSRRQKMTNPAQSEETEARADDSAMGDAKVHNLGQNNADQDEMTVD